MTDFSKSTFTMDDHRTVKEIISRVEKLTAVKVDRVSMAMDIEAAHMVCPLDLGQLRDFGPASMMHDVAGIGNHLNRETGELEDCFIPRCAV